MSHPILEVIQSSPTRVLSVTDLVVEASVVLGVAVKATLLDVLAMRLCVSKLLGDIAHVRGSLARVVLAVVAASAGAGAAADLVRGALARTDVQVLLCGCWAARVAGLGQVGTGEVALAAESFGVLFLSVKVLTGGADCGGGQGGSTGGVGVV